LCQFYFVFLVVFVLYQAVNFVLICDHWDLEIVTSYSGLLLNRGGDMSRIDFIVFHHQITVIKHS